MSAFGHERTFHVRSLAIRSNDIECANVDLALRFGRQDDAVLPLPIPGRYPVAIVIILVAGDDGPTLAHCRINADRKRANEADPASRYLAPCRCEELRQARFRDLVALLRVDALAFSYCPRALVLGQLQPVTLAMRQQDASTALGR